MRRNLAVLSIAAVLAAWGCGGSSGPAEQAKKGPPAIKVGLLLDNLHERWARDRDMIQEVVTDMGGELMVATADGDQAKQIQQAEKMLADGVKALIVVVHDTENASALVDKANAAKVPVIAYDRLMRDADVDLYIGFDIVEHRRVAGAAPARARAEGQLHPDRRARRRTVTRSCCARGR